MSGRAMACTVGYMSLTPSPGAPQGEGVQQRRIVFVIFDGFQPLDMALWLVGALHGRDRTRRVRWRLQYEPAPPYLADEPAGAAVAAASGG